MLDVAERQGMAVEFNTRFLYRDHTEEEKQRYIDANRRLLRKAKERGVGIAIGSDAHSPRDQGNGVRDRLGVLDELEINEIVFPIGGRLARVALRYVKPPEPEPAAAAPEPPPAPVAEPPGRSRCSRGKARRARRDRRPPRHVPPRARPNAPRETPFEPPLRRRRSATPKPAATRSPPKAARRKRERTRKPAAAPADAETEPSAPAKARAGQGRVPPSRSRPAKVHRPSRPAKGGPGQRPPPVEERVPPKKAAAEKSRAAAKKSRGEKGAR